MSPQEYHNYLEQLAYHFWLADGQPNGEDYVETFIGPMKIKHIHWLKAEAMAEIDLQILQDLAMIQSIEVK